MGELINRLRASIGLVCLIASASSCDSGVIVEGVDAAPEHGAASTGAGGSGGFGGEGGCACVVDCAEADGGCVKAFCCASPVTCKPCKGS